MWWTDPATPELHRAGSPAFLDRTGKPLRYDELFSAVEDWDGRFRRAGLRPGDTAVVDLDSPIDTVVTVVAALQFGLALLLNDRSLPRSIQRQRVIDAGASVAILGSRELSTVQNDGGDASGPRNMPVEGSLLLWTSGSTQAPRCAVLARDAIVWNARANACALGVVSTDCALVLLDLSYCYALVHQVMTHLVAGASSNLGLTRQRLAKGDPIPDRANTLAAVPSLWRWCMSSQRNADRMRGMRLLTLGGARTPRWLLDHTMSALTTTAVRITYGLTEAGPRVATADGDAALTRPDGWVGWPLPGVAVELSTEQEFLISSPSNRIGYVLNGEFLPDRGVVRTGDQGEICNDGSLVVLNRIGRVMNQGGVLVDLDKIERVLREDPAVTEARVVPADHRTLGHVAVAYVVTDTKAGANVSSLARRCRIALGEAHVPSAIWLVDRLATQQPPARAKDIKN